MKRFTRTLLVTSLSLSAITAAACDADDPIPHRVARDALSQAACEFLLCGAVDHDALMPRCLEAQYETECPDGCPGDWPVAWNGPLERCLTALVDVANACPDHRPIPPACLGLFEGFGDPAPIPGPEAP